MPFRQLPTTDAGRLQALETAAAKAAVVDPAELAFSAATKTTLDATLPQFRTEMQERGVALGAQVAATSALTTQRDRLRMWASHFFQNLNFGIDRAVFQAADRAFYQLATSQESLPSMSSEADLLMWTLRIVDGETARVAAGGTAIPFPTSGEVETERNAYVTLQADQSTKKDALDGEQEDVDALRGPVDELVLDIWDEVEFTFRKEEPASLRANAREYGVVYVSRPGEPSEPGGTEPTTLTGQWVEANSQAEFTSTESSDPNVSEYELRGSPGATYDPATATFINSLTVGTTPLEFQTTEHLANPGDTASFQVFVILTTGEEAGSNTVTITRP